MLLVDLSYELSYYERFFVLKGIIKDFYIHDSLFSAMIGNDIHFPFFIETFYFRDVNNPKDEKNYSSVIKQLFDYDLSLFDFNTKKEKILANVKLSLELINLNKENGKNKFSLQTIDNLNIFEKRSYFNILGRYLSKYTKYDCTVILNKHCVNYYSD